MHLKRTAKFVLLLDRYSFELRQLAMARAGEEGYLLIAHTAAAALEFAQQYRPTHAISTNRIPTLTGGRYRS